LKTPVLRLLCVFVSLTQDMMSVQPTHRTCTHTTQPESGFRTHLTDRCFLPQASATSIPGTTYYITPLHDSFRTQWMTSLGQRIQLWYVEVAARYIYC
jgi:hypothetical protein